MVFQQELDHAAVLRGRGIQLLSHLEVGDVSPKNIGIENGYWWKVGFKPVTSWSFGGQQPAVAFEA